MHFSFTHVFFYRFAIKAGGFPVMKILLFSLRAMGAL